MLSASAIWLSASGQTTDAVPVPWTIELPTVPDALVDPTCRNTPALANIAHCVGMPIQLVSGYFDAVKAAGWVTVAATGEMTVFERPTEGRICDLIIVQAAGDNSPSPTGSRRALVWFRQYERQECVSGR